MPPVAPDFLPYVAYTAADRELDRFVELTRLSYALAQQLLFATPKESLPPLSFNPPPFDEVSFGEQHVGAPDDVALQCEWLELGEHATRSGRSMAELHEAALAGELGPPEEAATEHRRYIWPPEFATKPREQLPAPGKKSFAVRIEVTALADGPAYDLQDPSTFEQAQQSYLGLAHALGEPEEVGDRAQAMLARSALLVQWTNFEVFLRETVGEMFRRHPELLSRGRRGKQSIDYGDLFAISDDLRSADALRHALAEREIESLRGGGQSVHGLINFLKTELRFKRDPYAAWYRWRGEPRSASYQAIQELKDLRNALVHEGEPPEEASLEVTHDRYLQARLMLGALAHRLSKQIAANEYSLQA